MRVRPLRPKQAMKNTTALFITLPGSHGNAKTTLTPVMERRVGAHTAYVGDPLVCVNAYAFCCECASSAD